MVDRISAADTGYSPGDLSIFPEALDDASTLYRVANNCRTKLQHTLTYNGKTIVVEDATAFPTSGILRVGIEGGEYELIYYESRSDNVFFDLKRGFAGSFRNIWYASGDVYVTIPVSADTHNATKDAVEQLEANLGIRENPADISLNGILKRQETRFLAPKPLFRAFPIQGTPSLNVRFQNFTTGDTVRYLWDFGDGGTSVERSPIHTFNAEGDYTVSLNVITSTGGQGLAVKTNYIKISNNYAVPFFYTESMTNPYSAQTAAARTAGGEPTSPKEFHFIDQTDGDLVQRNWIFGDGNQLTIDDPDTHTASHIYSRPGNYVVTLLIVFADGRLQRAELPDPLTVI